MTRPLPIVDMMALMWPALMVGALLTAGPLLAQLDTKPATGRAYAQWNRGPSRDPTFFPIAVWLQRPSDARLYKAAGVNTYVGLWKGPTEEQLADLRSAGMTVVCEMNAIGLTHRDDPTIVGWMHGDEPDNAQPLPEGKGYGPPIVPAVVRAAYDRIRAADPTRPVLLNLGQGVAWDGWHGRGIRSRHPEDYPHYLEGCDIASFDIYPVTHDKPEVQGKLWLVPFGVQRLREWSHDSRIVWNCIECTRIRSADRPTPAQVRAQVWMSLIAGSQGIIYFVHEWAPRFSERRLLEDREMLEAVTALNREIQGFAEILNAPTARDGVRVVSSPQEVPIACMLKRRGRVQHLFAINMRGSPARAAFEMAAGLDGAARVLGEDRTTPVRSGRFEDVFEPYGMHIYAIDGAASTSR